MLIRFLARQFSRPSGPIGRWIVGPWLDRIARAMNQLAFERLDPRPGEHILEVGFGGGDLLAMVLDVRPAQLVGVDISEAMVARAERRFAQHISRGTLSLHQASAERLPLASATIDKAASLNSLYFWPDIEGAFAELARVIRPGGMLILCFEPPEELRKWPGHKHGFRLYDAADLMRLGVETGFGNPAIASGVGRKPDHFLCLSLERLAA